MYQIIEMKEMNMEEALYLCEQEYITQQQKAKGMPEFNQEIRDKMEGILCRLKKSTYGKAMLCDGELVGFLGFFGPWNGFHGLAKGVFSPLGASAFAGEKREKTASMLIAAVAEEMVRDKIFSVALSRYAHDEEVNKAICLNSFGIRCSDAMLKLDNYVFSDMDSTIAIEELKGAEKLKVRDLYEELREHLSKSPCFFPTPEGQVDRWFANEGIRIFAARYENKIAGYMAIDEEAETFITEREDVCNICGAYVSKEFRSTGIAKQLLDAVVEVCMREGRAYLGVDYETINPTALRFWTKYFEPYTYSFIRRIDERIEQYE